jgi:hypothetical protein
MVELICKEEVYAIIGAAMQVYNEKFVRIRGIRG